MGLFWKLRRARQVLREEGIHRILTILRSSYKVPIPQSARSKWKAGIKSEVEFWDDYFRTKGLEWRTSYASRLDPDLPLQPRVAALLPHPANTAKILDVGAGPLTHLGKTIDGAQLRIIAVDALAEEYDKILAKYGITPIVRTEKLAAEQLTRRFPAATFDLVYARNCIDHAYNPETAILQMISVVKHRGHVLLEHKPNEAETEGYTGLHQWNFSMSPDGDFLISSKSNTVNMTKTHARLCLITCEMLEEPDGGIWLITRIRKH